MEGEQAWSELGQNKELSEHPTRNSNSQKSQNKFLYRRMHAHFKAPDDILANKIHRESVMGLLPPSAVTPIPKKQKKCRQLRKCKHDEERKLAAHSRRHDDHVNTLDKSESGLSEKIQELKNILNQSASTAVQPNTDGGA
jgi:hypothetical protein